MKIIIKSQNEAVLIRESKDCKDNEVLNAYAAAVAIKCSSMFDNKETALILLDKVYDFSREIINQAYSKQSEIN